MKFHRELELPGRTRVPDWEARAADYAECAAPDLCYTTRLAEIRVVKQIKSFKTHFVGEPLVDLRPLHQREIHVIEARSDD